jgi:hypothetical protein
VLFICQLVFTNVHSKHPVQRWNHNLVSMLASEYVSALGSERSREVVSTHAIGTVKLVRANVRLAAEIRLVVARPSAIGIAFSHGDNVTVRVKC